MLGKIKKEVLEANRLLIVNGLAVLSWGNLSAINDDRTLVCIKPSGVGIDKLKISDIVVVDLHGNILEGKYNPSSDTATHIEIYKAFTEVKSVAHTHSNYATAFAQACIPIKCIGTTHADHFYGDIPVINKLKENDIITNYEKNCGTYITDYYKHNNISPEHIPACLLPSHGPFIWGQSIQETLENTIILEEVAKLNFLTINITPVKNNLDSCLLNKHFFRKHGVNAYYGQKKKI